MTALSDGKIMKLIQENKLKITPFNKDAVTSNGYDMLTEDFEIGPGEFALIKSAEKISMPANIIAIPILRTTYAFEGLMLSQGVIDSGFKGYLKFALVNFSKNTIQMKKENLWRRAIHLVFLELSNKSLFPFGTREGEFNNSQ